MKAKKILGLVCLMALALPLLASAQIYKWKDKNGVTRYSDKAPAGSKQVDTLGPQTRKTVRPQRTDSSEDTRQPADARENTREAEFKEVPQDPEEIAAKIRARNAEIEKKNKAENERQAQIDKDNCRAARANYQTYAQGGRIYKVDENGNRIYVDDAGLAAGKKSAQAEVSKYCK